MISLFSIFILGITGALLYLAYQAPTKRSISIPGIRKVQHKVQTKVEPIDLKKLREDMEKRLKEAEEEPKDKPEEELKEEPKEDKECS